MQRQYLFIHVHVWNGWDFTITIASMQEVRLDGLRGVWVASE